MASKSFRGLPRILKINNVDKRNLRISVLFNNGKSRILDFKRILKDEWKVTKSDPEHILLIPKEFAKVQLIDNTLSWDNVEMYMTGKDGKKEKVPFDIGADVLYKLSEEDKERSLSIGQLLRRARLKAQMTQDEVAKLSGTSRTYITKLENDTQDVELMTLIKIVEAGLGKHLKITIE